MEGYIYADNAATTRISSTAAAAQREAEEKYYGNPSSLHSAGQRAAEALAAARADFASALGAEPKEIIFTSGGSEADNQALRSAAALGKKAGKTHIISTAFEHHAVLHTLHALEAEGFTVTLLPVHGDGLVRPDELRAAITPETCLVSVMYANNEIGTVQPIAELGAICSERRVIFHTDAVQAVGHIKIDVKAQNIDMLSLSAHKFHGSRGVGALYVRRGIKVLPLIEGGAQEGGRRAGTENLPGIVGAAVALRESQEKIAERTEYVQSLRDRLISGLEKIPHSALNGDRNKRLPGNVSFCFEGIEGESILLCLDLRGIAASSGSACTSGSLEPSHVLLAIGRTHETAHGSLRLTLSAENTEEEVDRIISATAETVSYLRGMSPLWHELENGTKKFTF